jgi:hypothetical protein
MDVQPHRGRGVTDAELERIAALEHGRWLEEKRRQAGSTARCATT